MLDRLLDATIVRSFDRSGYRRHARRFDPADLEVDLESRSILVTGANSGLGLATASALAELGARVSMLCRDRQRGLTARDLVRRRAGHDRVDLELVDLADLASVRRCAERFTERPVDVLIHNAGILPAERRPSADGIEITLATNTVGPFLLTSLLLPRLAAAGDARVIDVTSGGLYTQRLDVARLLSPPDPFDGVVAYAQTKRANLILTGLWAEHTAGSGIAFNSMHPGWADTPGVERSLPRFWRLMKNHLRSAEEGADTTVWLAAAERAGRYNGRFWFDRRQVPAHLLPWTRERPGDRQELWRAIRRLAGRAHTNEPPRFAEDA